MNAIDFRRILAQWLLFMSLSVMFSTNCSAEIIDNTTNSLTIERCLAVARAHNPRILAAREKINELAADYTAARSKFFPRIAVNSYYYRIDPNRLAAGGPTTAKLYSSESSHSLTGKQILFDGFKTYFSQQAAGIGKQVQGQETENVTLAIEYAVTESFYRLIEADENTKVAKNALMQRREFEHLTRAFYEAGKVTKLDFFRASSQASEAEQAVTEATNARQVAGMLLAKTMGSDLDSTSAAAIKISGGRTDAAFPVLDFEALWKQAQEANSEIKKLDLEIAQSKKLIQAAQADYFPEISLQGSTGKRHRDRGGSEGEWLGGVFMEFPIFEGGLTRAQVAKASSQNIQLVELKRNRIDELRVELKDAFRGLENARQGLVTARQMIQADTEGYDSSLALYKYGKATGLDVLQAQVDLTRSQFALISHEVASNITQARIKQIIGR